MDNNKIDIEKLIELVKVDANKKRDDAAYCGDWGDGGARLLEGQIEFFNYGREGIIPPQWDKYAIQLDPDYEMYIKLKNKFEK